MVWLSVRRISHISCRQAAVLKQLPRDWLSHFSIEFSHNRQRHEFHVHQHVNLQRVFPWYLHPPPALLPHPDNRDHKPPAYRSRALSHSICIRQHGEWQVFSHLNSTGSCEHTFSSDQHNWIRSPNSAATQRRKCAPEHMHTRFKVSRHGSLY